VQQIVIVVVVAVAYGALALVSKLVPIISIWELKGGKQPGLQAAASVHEAETAGELL